MLTLKNPNNAISRQKIIFPALLKNNNKKLNKINISINHHLTENHSYRTNSKTDPHKILNSNKYSNQNFTKTEKRNMLTKTYNKMLHIHKQPSDNI